MATLLSVSFNIPAHKHRDILGKFPGIITLVWLLPAVFGFSGGKRVKFALKIIIWNISY